MKKIIILCLLILYSCSDSKTSSSDNKNSMYDVKWEEISHYFPTDYPELYLKDSKGYGSYEYIDIVTIEESDSVAKLTLIIMDKSDSFVKYSAVDDMIEKIRPFYNEFHEYDCDIVKYSIKTTMYGSYIQNVHKVCEMDGYSENHDIKITYESNKFAYNSDVVEIEFTFRKKGEGAIFIPSDEISDVIQFNIYNNTAIAYTKKNELYSWGNNNNGKLGIGNRCNYNTISISNRGGNPFYVEKKCDEDFPVKIMLNNITKLFYSDDMTFAFAVTENDQLYAWGSNSYGRLGVGNDVDKYSPVEVTGIQGTIENIYVNDSSVFAITGDKKLYAWGNNSSGKLGVGDNVDKYSPVEVTGIQGTIENMYVNGSSVFAITGDKKLYAWGSNSYGQLGVGDNVYKYSPVEVTGIQGTIENIYVNDSSVFAITGDKKLYAWGYNRYGELGVGDDVDKYAPVEVTGIQGTIENIYVNGSSVFAITGDNKLYAWGRNSYGRLGVGNDVDKYSPVEVTGIQGTIENMYVNGSSVFAITGDKKLYAWGNNSSGKLGVGDNVDKYSPVEVTGIQGTIENMYVNGSSVFAITGDKKLYAWGSNSYGQLGVGDNVYKYSPVEVTGIQETIENIYVNDSSVFAITGDKKLYAWGRNSYGRLGVGDDVDKYAPVEVTGIQGTVKNIFFSNSSVFLLSSNGKIYTWGKEIGRPYYKYTPETVKYVS